jgi:hypothetical protein
MLNWKHRPESERVEGVKKENGRKTWADEHCDIFIEKYRLKRYIHLPGRVFAYHFTKGFISCRRY